MAGIGLYGVFAAKAIIENGVVTGYTDFQKIGRAIEAEFTPTEIETDNLYADNAIAETDAQAASGGEIKMVVDRLTRPGAELLFNVSRDEVTVTVGETTVKGARIRRTGSEEANAVGIAYIRWNQEDNDRNHHEVVIYRRATFQMPSEVAETMGESVEWQTVEINGTVIGREGDGANAWTEAVDFPTQTAALAYIRQYFDTEAADDDEN